MSLQPPELRFISCVTGTWITADQATDPGYWGLQLREPVRFSRGLRTIQQAAQVLLEVGPGQTLCYLAQQHELQHDVTGQPLVEIASSRHPREQESDVRCMTRILGRLWQAGVKVDWEQLHDGQNRRRLSLPTYPFERTRYWLASRSPTPAGSNDVVPAAAPSVEPATDALPITSLRSSLACRSLHLRTQESGHCGNQSHSARTQWRGS